MSTLKEVIHVMHQNPLTPLFLLKTEQGEMFEVKKDSIFLAPHLKDIYRKNSEYINGQNATIITLKPLIETPKIDFTRKIPIDGDFSTFNPFHQRIAGKLTKIFYKSDINDMPSIIGFIRDRINSRLYFYSLSMALAHREDTRDIPGDIVYAFPFSFFKYKYLEMAFNKGNRQDTDNQEIITLEETSSNEDKEHLLAYFREDIGLNSHHWHWHVIYPFEGDFEMVNKDRKGELFLYMHNQIMARYKTERFCASLPRVEAFDNYRQPMKEGYYSKLRISNASKDYPGRPTNLPWMDLNRPADQLKVTVNEMISWKTRIEQAIDLGSVIIEQQTFESDQQGNRIIRSKDLTADILGNIIESNILSVNRNYYGILHNFGHLIPGYVHDPDGRYLETMAILVDNTVSLRDPFFYRWHEEIDNIYQKFKTSPKSTPYQEKDLLYDGITVGDIQIVEDESFYRKTKLSKSGTNDFHTFNMNTVIKVNGLDFEKTDPILVEYKHLDHVPFSYRITVENKKQSRKGTVRIFIGPKYNKEGNQMKLNDQRLVFAELDRFVYNFKSGNNVIIRKSVESSVTIPLEQFFPETYKNKSTEVSDLYCRCGWPQNLLISKGSLTGVDFQLFLMVSDYQIDMVKTNDIHSDCKESSSYCGLKDNKYPDARSMGYPFDRLVDETFAIYIQDFVKNTPNMSFKEVSVKYTDTTVEDPKNENVRKMMETPKKDA